MANRKTTKKYTRKTRTTKTATPLSTRKRSTGKTAPSPQKNTPPTTPASSTSDPQSAQKAWRVFPISDALRDGLKQLRDATPVPTSLRQVVADCVVQELPDLVDALTRLSLDPERSQPDNPVRPIRMQINEETLARLRYAAQQTGLPAQRLMVACCRLASARQSR